MGGDFPSARVRDRLDARDSSRWLFHVRVGVQSRLRVLCAPRAVGGLFRADLWSCGPRLSSVSAPGRSDCDVVSGVARSARLAREVCGFSDQTMKTFNRLVQRTPKSSRG